MWKFSQIVLVLLSASLVATAEPERESGREQGYQFCSELDDMYYRQTCSQVVGRAHFFQKELFDFCNHFQIYHTTIYCLDRGRNSVLNVSELKACADSVRGFGPLGNDEARLDCLDKNSQAAQREMRSVASEVSVSGWYSYQKAWAAVEREAVNLCRGWQTYHFETPEWQSSDCWWNEMSGSFDCKTQVFCKKKIPANSPSVIYTKVWAKPRL